MKKLIISLFAFLTCVTYAEVAQTAQSPKAEPVLMCCPVSGSTAVCPAQAPILIEAEQEIEAPDLSQATDFGNMKVQASPYNFSSIEALRVSVLAQAKKEGIATEIAETSFGDLAVMLIDNHLDMLAECEDDTAADKLMMTLFMRAMKAKPLKEIFGLR